MLPLSFTIHLDGIRVGYYVPPHRPLFHRWLPDGRDDALDLRNDIVHRGKECGDPGWKLFLSLMECGEALLGLTELTPAVLYAENELSEPP